METFQILLIEDDPNAVYLIREMLHSDALLFDITSTGTLAEGVGRLGDSDWNAILLDLSLPDSSGLETFRRVHGENPRLPVIVLTGHDDENLAIEAVHAGAQDYLVKGNVNGALLVRSIRYAIERCRIQDALQESYDALELRVQERTRELSDTNEQLKREIADRQQAEEKLRDTNQLLEQALRELRETQRQVIQRERLHALGDMASGIAHDFNNALAPIVGFSELLLMNPKNLEDRAKLENYLKMIRSSAKSAAEVVRSLRDFSRERTQMDILHPFDLNKLVEETVSITKPKWRDLSMAQGASISINTDLETTPPVFGSEEEFEQALTSLVFNAVEAMNRDGTITIRTRLRGARVQLEIEDEGCGMTDEVLSKCLDPFFSTKGKNGSGFGLTSAFGVVERHAGTMDIRSKPGEGTTIRIELPVRSQDVEEKGMAVDSAPPPASPGVAMRPLNVLVGDDEPLLREVIMACLVADGHRVTATTSGTELLEEFGKRQYDLVITDRAMPGLSGDQVALRVKAADPEMKVILLTGFGSLMEATNEHPEGVDLIVGKPFTVESLRDAIRNVLAERPGS